ncbi:hypothetical protein ABIA69_004437 [Lysinibacillus parviboronicapiens]|uniref:Intracellular proteinase inhibitor BsuPI domain-containing protein n=1 Tax=Lysinibacillus parviboronicapiens TaxID=436516 RepID=A0ABV2PQL0_9BACI
MKIYKLAHICSICIILSGCSMYSSQTEEPSSNGESKVIKNEPVALDTTQKKKEKELKEERIEVTHERMIDEQIVSSLGESKSYFTIHGDLKVKIYLLNTGTKSFRYSIRNADDKRQVAAGLLKENESYEQVFNDLPEGAYLISCVVQEETPPVDIALSVKVELGK